MSIINYINAYIQLFLDRCKQDHIKQIHKSEVYDKFTALYPGFKESVFDKTNLEAYLLSEITKQTIVEVK
jgi:hypothetical protein